MPIIIIASSSCVHRLIFDAERFFQMKSDGAGAYSASRAIRCTMCSPTSPSAGAYFSIRLLFGASKRNSGSEPHSRLPKVRTPHSCSLKRSERDSAFGSAGSILWRSLRSTSTTSRWATKSAQNQSPIKNGHQLVTHS